MKYMYKCRQCGVIYGDTHKGGDNEDSHGHSIYDLCAAMNNYQADSNRPKMLDLHHCGSLRTGISDLIGVVPSKET